MYSHVYYAYDMSCFIHHPYKQHVSSNNHLAGLVQCFTAFIQSVGNRLEGR